MIKIIHKVGFFFVIFIALSYVQAYGIPDTKENDISNTNEKFYDSKEYANEDETSDLDKIQRMNQLLQNIKQNQHSNYLYLNDVEASDNLDIEPVMNRDRRRLSVFKNVYQKCRIQKRKEKTLCLYLANLYHNVKGFHGL
ncbi:unnamed protein product [Brachionus calyciflorus]|uniref:Uncharacterized protein n=1 Tax=Brachionus calyciflorus TaxID=104777 RepID=A0A813NMX2_9BILA|nr:unnamed protein product [Brachionus calyciflorus]